MGKKEDMELKRQKKLEKAKKNYNEGLKNIKNYTFIGAFILVFALILFLVYFASVYNTEYGTEVSINGFQVLSAKLDGLYTSSDTKYGDMAVPFYYYAGASSVYKGYNYVLALANMTLISFILIVIAIGTNIGLYFLIKKKNIPALAIINIFLSVAIFVTLLVAHIKGIGMNNSDILPTYCSGNKACSIRSYAILPGVIALLSSIPSIIYVLKYLKFKNEYQKFKH